MNWKTTRLAPEDLVKFTEPKQRIINRQVAIKVILPVHANQEDFIQRFETEAQLVAKLEHPHIVPLYDFWRDPTGAYLVMRWLQGGNLADSILLGDSLEHGTDCRVTEPDCICPTYGAPQTNCASRYQTG